MSVTTLCQICEAAVASDRCDQCGTLVCRSHYVDEYGLCTECAADIRPSDGRNSV